VRGCSSRNYSDCSGNRELGVGVEELDGYWVVGANTWFGGVAVSGRGKDLGWWWDTEAGIHSAGHRRDCRRAEVVDLVRMDWEMYTAGTGSLDRSKLLSRINRRYPRPESANSRLDNATCWKIGLKATIVSFKVGYAVRPSDEAVIGGCGRPAAPNEPKFLRDGLYAVFSRC
jgi:hypothetical protein